MESVNYDPTVAPKYCSTNVSVAYTGVTEVLGTDNGTSVTDLVEYGASLGHGGTA